MILFRRVLSLQKPCSVVSQQLIYNSFKFESTSAQITSTSLKDHDRNKYKFTPCEVYDQKVASGDLTDDIHQREVVEHFTHLHSRIQEYSPPSLSKPNALTKWLMVNQIIKVREEKRVKKIPRGVYVWGTVGGGLYLIFFKLSIFLELFLPKFFVFCNCYRKNNANGPVL